MDRSQPLLDEARRRAGGARWPKLTRADYRELPFGEESFDAAFNLFTSLGYLGDDEDVKALAAIRRVLRPGAQARARDHAPRPADRGLERQRLAADGGGTAAARAAHVRPADRRRAVHPDADRRRAATRETRTFSVRVYTATELLRMLERAGYSDAKAYGSFDGEPFTTEHAALVG